MSLQVTLYRPEDEHPDQRGQGACPEPADRTREFSDYRGISHQWEKNKLSNKYNWEGRHPFIRKCSKIPSRLHTKKQLDQSLNVKEGEL